MALVDEYLFIVRVSYPGWLLFNRSAPLCQQKVDPLKTIPLVSDQAFGRVGRGPGQSGMDDCRQDSPAGRVNGAVNLIWLVPPIHIGIIPKRALGSFKPALLLWPGNQDITFRI